MTEAPAPLFGLILAGGRSSRMGLDRPKPLLDVGGRSMVRRVAERLRPFVTDLVVVTDRPDLYADLGAGCLSDVAPGYPGPLAGLQAGALHALRAGGATARLVSAPADTPFLPEDLVPHLLGAAATDDIRVAAFEDRLHPACALWPVESLHRLATLRLDAADAPSLQSMMRRHGFVAVPFPSTRLAPGGDPFFNVNTPADLETARRFALSGG